MVGPTARSDARASLRSTRSRRHRHALGSAAVAVTVVLSATVFGAADRAAAALNEGIDFDQVEQRDQGLVELALPSTLPHDAVPFVRAKPANIDVTFRTGWLGFAPHDPAVEVSRGTVVVEFVSGGQVLLRVGANYGWSPSISSDRQWSPWILVPLITAGLLVAYQIARLVGRAGDDRLMASGPDRGAVDDEPTGFRQ